MAKKSLIPKLLQAAESTPAQAQAAPAHDKTMTISVGLKASEIERLGAIAAEHGVTRNSLMAFAMRRFLKEVDAGRVDIAKATKTVNKL